MIIQCDKCKTKFKLDDSKVKDTGTKVRCAKCRNVFTVAKDVPEQEPRADFAEMLDDSVAATVGASSFAEEPEQVPVPPARDEISGFETGDAAEEDSSDAGMEFDATVFDDPADKSEDLFAEEPVAEGSDEISFGDVTDKSRIEIQADSQEVDFGSFDFGEAAGPAEERESASPSFDFGDAEVAKSAPAAAAAPVKKEFGGLDFSDDDMFGEVAPQAAEESSESISFDLGMDGFADAMRNDDGFSAPKPSFGGTDLTMESPFSLDEIDFGDDLTSVAIQQVNPEELKPSQEILFGPLAEAQAKPERDAGEIFFETEPAAPKQELPPLPIASRRKQGPFSTAVIAVIGVAVVAVLAFFGYNSSTGDKEKAAQESGKISVREVEATFVKNKLTGDLLVISGEVVNEFSKPRAAIQVKGMVYGADGQVLASKNAFCGNPLTPQQLATMSLDKIEAAMANQFGDSLANMEVAPGKAIPFVIVMAKPDKAAKDYGVEPAGSTVAAGKQQ